MEEVSVLWDVAGKPTWWGAEVIDIKTETQPPSDSLLRTDSTTPKKIKPHSANATIRYHPRRGYPSENHNVCFMLSVSKAKKLQHITPTRTGFVSWKFPEENVPLPDSHNSSLGKTSKDNEVTAHLQSETNNHFTPHLQTNPQTNPQNDVAMQDLSNPAQARR